MPDDNLKDLRKRLETAINETLTDSPRINLTIQDLRERGYDTFLIIEATIGFNRIEERGSKSEEEGASEKVAPAAGKNSGTVKLRLSSQDAKFLKSLKISPE
ncbi:MAG: hypothetical protein ACR2L2_09585 [Acidobacteriota bacterium]